MPVELYHMELSAPCRSVRWVAATIGVELNLKVTNLMAGEQLTPEFLKLNPQHTIPTIVDGDFSLGESRAICTYLINKYAPGHALYPTCLRKRALVDRYLYFDIGTLYKAFGEYFYPKILHGKEYEPEKEQKVKEALGFLETFLGDDQNFLVGKEVTVADLCIGCTLSVLEVTGYGFASFPKIEAYYNRTKQLPHYEECNAKGIEEFKQLIASKSS